MSSAVLSSPPCRLLPRVARTFMLLRPLAYGFTRLMPWKSPMRSWSFCPSYLKEVIHVGETWSASRRPRGAVGIVCILWAAFPTLLICILAIPSLESSCISRSKNVPSECPVKSTSRSSSYQADVTCAFDNMKHKLVKDANLKQGAAFGLTGVFLN